MKTKIALFLIIGSVFTISSHANAQGAIITWTGNSGYSAQITMTYNSLFANVFATGGSTFPGLTNQGITSLVVSFFSPSSPLTPIYSVIDVSNSVVSYGFLNIAFDTTNSSLAGLIDVGKDTFAEGLPGSSAGEYYLHGAITSPTLMDAGANLQLDSGGSFNVTIVPEPETWEFFGAAGLVFFAFRLRGRPDQSPEPTAVGAAVASHVTSRRWRSFGR